MCGIFFISKLNINYRFYPIEIQHDKIRQLFMSGSSRGPDHHSFIILPNYYVGFHRLSINGINAKSNQPFIKNGVYVICNGEIYNFKKLYTELNILPTSSSDCEIIIDLYLAGWSSERIVSTLDGVFSFIIYDTNNENLIVGRDPFGVRPLYYIYDKNYDTYSFASEFKQLFPINNVNHFSPGHYFQNGKFYKYHSLCNFNIDYVFNSLVINNTNILYSNLIKQSLISAVSKRLLSDRPIACLLSGGLDSSLICSIVSKLSGTQINTFSIGLKGSTDLKYAKIVSEYLKTNHTEIIMTEDEFFNSIPEVIEKISSYDTTTVRASVGNYLISKYISQNTDFKVIFNGDGSDEITGGYLYFHKSPNKLDSHNECVRLLSDIHYFDVLRSDRSISSCGLEPRTPFLDKSFVNLYLSIPLEYRFQTNAIEKKLLRDSFTEFLPNEILYRKKEAFSDGVSGNDRSWFEIIAEKLNDVDIPDFKYKKYLEPQTKEQLYYRYLFEKYYTGCETIIPYFWMPKWSNTSDPSARTLHL